MKAIAKELFANSVVARLSDLDAEQQRCVKTAILEEIDNYIIYTPEEAAEIIKEPLLMLDKFLSVKHSEGLSTNTLKLYKFNITHFISHTVKTLMEISSDDIRNYLNCKVTGGLSLAYANNIRASISSFFNWMFDYEYIDRNPMCRVKRIKYERELQPCFNEIEIDALRRAAARNPRNLALVDFMLSTGCRVSEVCSVNQNDVNFAARRLRVTGKGNKQRIVYLTDVAICTLKAYLMTRNDDNDALFVNNRVPHDRITPRSIQAALKDLGKLAHIENVHPHRFRHTCCTRLLCRGMELQNVSRILGHANVNTTMYYNNTTDDYIDGKFRQFSF